MNELNVDVDGLGCAVQGEMKNLSFSLVCPVMCSWT